MTTRADAEALDAVDPLAAWRDEFIVVDPALAYLDGNSLGMPARRTVDAMRRVVDEEWAGGLIRSWDHWVDLPLRAGAAVARLIGADAGEVVVHDSTTVNLYQLVHAGLALRPERRVLAVDPDDFPSDVYVVAGIGERAGVEVRHDIERLDDVAVVVRSVVDYRTAEVADVAAETARATEAGAVVVWDLSHAVGVLDLDLHADGVELAVGCTYKFLGSGPGAPGFAYVRRDLVEVLDQPIRGWFGRDDQFAMPAHYEPRSDIGRLLIGTPGIVGIAAVEAAATLVAEAGIGAIRDKAVRLTRLALDLCAEHGLDSPTPQDDRRRGGHVSVRHPQAGRLVEELAGAGVLADSRRPDLIRLGCSPLTTRYTDVWTAVTTLARLA